MIPDFIKKMNEFISRAKQLKTSIPKVMGEYKHLGIVGIGGSQVQPLVFRPHASIPTTHLEVPDPYILNTFLTNKDLSDRISKKGKEKAKHYLFERVSKKYVQILEDLHE